MRPGGSSPSSPSAARASASDAYTWHGPAEKRSVTCGLSTLMISSHAPAALGVIDLDRVWLVAQVFEPDLPKAEGARAAFLAAGGRARDLAELEVPGAFELPLAARVAAASGRFDAVVALGAVVRGDTDHYEHVAREAAAGLQRAALDTGVPVAFGVLTVRDVKQALARCAPGPDNKGAEAARAALAMVAVLQALRARKRGR